MPKVKIGPAFRLRSLVDKAAMIDKKRGKRLRFVVQRCTGCMSWNVWRGTESLRTLIATRSTKKAAVEYAIREAKKRKPSQVLIANRLGRYEQERTYGSDPHPPKG
jgi:hypothetical protein